MKRCSLYSNVSSLPCPSRFKTFSLPDKNYLAPIKQLFLISSALAPGGHWSDFYKFALLEFACYMREIMKHVTPFMSAFFIYCENNVFKVHPTCSNINNIYICGLSRKS